MVRRRKCSAVSIDSGRRGFLKRGGDTQRKTLWKYKVGNQYSFGEFQNGEIYIEGPNEQQVFTTNEEGQILYLVQFDQSRIPQLKAFFAKFFGEIQTISIVVKQGLNVGDNVPNWDSYELLE